MNKVNFDKLIKHHMIDHPYYPIAFIKQLKNTPYRYHCEQIFNFNYVVNQLRLCRRYIADICKRTTNSRIYQFYDGLRFALVEIDGFMNNFDYGGAIREVYSLQKMYNHIFSEDKLYPEFIKGVNIACKKFIKIFNRLSSLGEWQ